MVKFPIDFYWGGAISAPQAEGAWDLNGRGPTMLDITTQGSRETTRKVTFIDINGQRGFVEKDTQLPNGAHGKIFDDQYYPNHEAVDFYHHYKEDIRLFAEMGFKMLRLSISWSRLFPKGDEKEPVSEGIEFYKNVFEELHKYQIEPMVTLWHFDTPLYLEEHYGGWKNRKLIDYFCHYAKTCFEAFQGLVKYWLTFNEINSSILFLDANGKIVTREMYQDTFQSLHHQLLASARVVKMAHKIDENNRLGCMICGITYYPFTCDPKDILLNEYNWQQNIYYCSDVQCSGSYGSYAKKLWRKYDVLIKMEENDYKELQEGRIDFYSFSYYMSNNVTTHENTDVVSGNWSAGVRNPYLTYSQWGWSFDPDGLQYFLEKIYDRYKIPMMIVENGLGAIDVKELDHSIHDQYRINYIKSHIKATQKAMCAGVDMIGYLVWSAIDIVSASTGEMKKRYGLIYVDKNDDGTGTLNRYKKDSFYWYKQVIKSNGECTND